MSNLLLLHVLQLKYQSQIGIGKSEKCLTGAHAGRVLDLVADWLRREVAYADEGEAAQE